jgi:hypothetical protein
MITAGLREKALEIYKQLIGSGRDISIIGFAREAERYLGEPVPILTIKDWAQDDRWADIIVSTSFNATPELRNKKSLFDSAYRDVLDSDNPTDKAAMARAFFNIAKAIPSVMRHKVEPEIVDVREHIFSYLENEPDIPKPKKSSLYKTWIDLETLIVGESFGGPDDDEDRIEADQIVMESRLAASNPTAS